MKRFALPIDKEKFRNTNAPWNELMLNSPWSVGYVSMLIELKVFKDKEEWEDFYFEMGEYRLKQLKNQSPKIQKILEDEQLVRKDKTKIYNLPKSIKDINYQNGRTKEQLKRKGEILYNHIHTKHPEISQEDCYQAVKYRVIGETWNGIILREHNTIKTLKKLFPTADFIKKEGQFDYTYAVDYEIYHNGKLICGIQIKPKSYTYNTPYILKAKKTNKTKNQKYQNKFNAPVLDIIATSNGKLLNNEEVDRIGRMILPKNK